MFVRALAAYVVGACLRCTKPHTPALFASPECRHSPSLFAIVDDDFKGYVVEGVGIGDLGNVVPLGNFVNTGGQFLQHVSPSLPILSIWCIVRKSCRNTKEDFVGLFAAVIGLNIAVDIDSSSVPVFGQVNTLCINIF